MPVCAPIRKKFFEPLDLTRVQSSVRKPSSVTGVALGKDNHELSSVDSSLSDRLRGVPVLPRLELPNLVVLPAGEMRRKAVSAVYSQMAARTHPGFFLTPKTFTARVREGQQTLLFGGSSVLGPSEVLSTSN